MSFRAVSSSLSRIFTGVRFVIHASTRQLSTELGDHLSFTTEVNNVQIHCLKVGNGPHNILLMPGSLGNGTINYMPQLTGLDRNLFTIYSWDPPGYGKSRPPKKTWTPDVFYRDAADAASFLKALDLKETSLVGFSYGSVIALVLTTLYPSLVNRVVVSGAHAYITKDMVEVMEALRDIDGWNPREREPFENEYGEELQEFWDEYVNAMASFSTGNFAGNIIRNRIQEIKSPTLIFYGGKDYLLSSEHPHFLFSQIRGAQLVSWPNAKHDLHQTHAEEFNKIITNFFTK